MRDERLFDIPAEQLRSELLALRARIAQYERSDADLREAQAAIRSERERFGLVVESSNDGIWDWALERIARKIKDTRDNNWVEEDNGFTVNRTEAIACLGGAALDNEECYLYSKLARGLSIVYLEHQARI